MAKTHCTEIILTTLNARYMHTAFGLRYLYANLDDLQSSACIEEFTIQQRPIDEAKSVRPSLFAVLNYTKIFIILKGQLIA